MLVTIKMFCSETGECMGFIEKLTLIECIKTFHECLKNYDSSFEYYWTRY